MKIKLILVLSVCFQTIFAQGVKFDKEKYENLPNYEPDKTQGFASGVLPSKISYRAYCPPISDQEQLSTCVGWATSYAQLSTQQNILMGETNEMRKTIRVMDPYFVYAMIRDYSDSWCQQGAYMWEALDVVLNNGSKPYLTPPWLACNSTYEIDKFALAVANIYSVNKYYALVDKTNLVTTLKTLLNNKKVISVGVDITSSFIKGTGVKYGKWTPTQNEQISGAHAMCIVGYDDTKYGGSFELMNSYGTEFGDKGFVWISYSDIKKYLNEAYVIELNSGSTGYRIGNCTFGDCYSSYSRYKYNNGEVYEGEFSNGYKNRWGMLLYSDNSFYIGGFSNGYKNGSGIVYLPSTGFYYKTVFNYGTLQSSQYYQGFSGTEDDKKLDKLINALQLLVPGKIIDSKSEAYQDFVDSSKSEGEPEQVKDER